MKRMHMARDETDLVRNVHNIFANIRGLDATFAHCGEIICSFFEFKRTEIEHCTHARQYLSENRQRSMHVRDCVMI
jgi:hypothetical protein